MQLDVSRVQEPFHLKHDAAPFIDPPRRCPIHLRDKIGALTDQDTGDGHHPPTPAFSQAKYFTKLDAKAGYWSVKLAPTSQELTSFRSPFGRYCFTRLPFGLNVSQDLFQQHMDRILAQCEGVVGTINDLVVLGDTEEQEVQGVLNFFRIARQEGLKLNSSNCVQSSLITSPSLAAYTPTRESCQTRRRTRTSLTCRHLRTNQICSDSSACPRSSPLMCPTSPVKLLYYETC